MKFRLFTFAHENPVEWGNSILSQRIAFLNYTKNGFKEDEIIEFTDDDIKDLVAKCPDHFNLLPWFFGHFVWRPYLFLKVLNDLDYGDIAIGSDIGSLVVGDIKDGLLTFMKEKCEDMFFFKEAIPMYMDCKRDLFYQIPVDYEKYKDYRLLRGCFWAVRKTKQTEFYINKVYENMLKIENVDQTVRIEKNPDDFVLNHSGQAVLTLTLINQGFDFISFTNKVDSFLNDYKNFKLIIHVCRNIRNIEGLKKACDILQFTWKDFEYLAHYLITYD